MSKFTNRTYILLKSMSKAEVKYYSPTPPVDLPDPWPEARVIGHKVALFRRALTEYGVEIMPVGNNPTDPAPLWGARFEGCVKTFRSVMTSDQGYKTFRAVGDKAWTKRKLDESGVKTPLGVSVDKEHLEESFRRLGHEALPGVVKPKAGSHGRNVSLNIHTFEEFREAIGRIDGDAIFEREIHGNDYRILTAGSKVVAATLRKPANVTGDGARTIEQLIRQKNVARSANPSLCRCPIEIDEETLSLLEHKGLTLNDTPARGQNIQLKRVANIGAGGDSMELSVGECATSTWRLLWLVVGLRKM